ncbi:MAG: hypothetical protein Fur0018_26250 [Anaerolineales bacterium]
MNPLPASTAHSPKEVNFESAVQTARDDILQRILNGGMILLGALTILNGVQRSHWGLEVISYALGAFLFYRLSDEKLAYRLRVFVLLGALFFGGVLQLMLFHLPGIGGFYLLAVPVFAVLLLGDVAGYVAGALSALALLTGLFLGAYAPPAPPDALDWLNLGLNFVFVLVMLVQSQLQLTEAQEYVVTVSKQKRELQETRAELTQRTRQLDYERYLLHTLMDNVSDRIFFKDRNGRYLRISKALAERIGVAPQAILGKTDFDFFAAEYAAQVQMLERRVMENEESVLDQVIREVGRDGSERWIITSRLPMRNEEGQITGCIGTAQDITEIQIAQTAAQQRAQRLATASEVGRAISSVLEPDELFPLLAQVVQKSFGYYSVNVWLEDSQCQTVVLRAVAGRDLDVDAILDRKITLRLDQPSIVVDAIQRGVVRIVNDTQQSDEYLHLDEFPFTRSEMVVPLPGGDGLRGALDVQSDQPGVFTDEDRQLLQLLADQLSIAIRNAEAYRAERAQRQLAETMYYLGQALSSTLDLSKVLELILNRLGKLVHFDRAAVLLRDNDELEFAATRGFPQAHDSLQHRIPLRENDIFDEICRTMQPVVIPEVLKRADWQHTPGIPKARAWLGLPLMYQKQVVGMVSLVRIHPRPYTIDEIALASMFAGQAAVAIQNARLYAEIKRVSGQLEDMVTERTSKLQEAYHQLERMDRTKSDFIQVAAHELRTPLTVMSGYAQMLLKDETVRQNEHFLELVDGIHTGTRRLHDIVNSMVDIAKLDGSALQLYPEPISLRLLIEMVAQKVEPALKERNLTLAMRDLKTLPPMEGDPDALRKIFHHLIENAIKYTPDGGKITIFGRYVPAGEGRLEKDGLEVLVEDTGIGISPEYQESIFTKFVQTGAVALHSSGKTKFKGGGPGLGLAIVRGLVEAHGGRIWCQSPGYDEQACPGSTFIVALPLRQGERATWDEQIVGQNKAQE